MDFQKYNIKEKKKKKNKVTRIIKNKYIKFALKNRVFFLQSNRGHTESDMTEATWQQ